MRLPSPGLMRVFAMELFAKLFGDLLLFVYHCFDRIVINGYLSGLSRPEQVVHFFRKVVGVAVLSKEILSQRTAEYQNWVEAFARNHNIPVEWAEKGARKEDYVLPWLRRMTKRNAYGVYFIFKSMEQGPTFRVSVRIPPRIRTTASLPASAAASPTTTSTSAMKFSAPWRCVSQPSSRSKRHITSTATASSSRSSIVPRSASARRVSCTERLPWPPGRPLHELSS